MNSSQKLMILFAASCLAINASEYAPEGTDCVNALEESAPAASTALNLSGDLFTLPLAITVASEEVCTTPPKEIVPHIDFTLEDLELEDPSNNSSSTHNESSLSTVLNIFEPAENTSEIQDSKEVRKTPPQEIATLEDVVLENEEHDVNSEDSSASTRIFSRTNSQSSTEPTTEPEAYVSLAKAIEEAAHKQELEQNAIISTSSSNNEALGNTNENVSDVGNEVSSAASLEVSSTFIDATLKKPAPELPWYKKFFGYFTTQK